MICYDNVKVICKSINTKYLIASAIARAFQLKHVHDVYLMNICVV